MARFGHLGQQYFDNKGDPLSNGYIQFYEPSTTTPKTTYSDDALTIPNANPYLLDADGRQGDIFFDGEANAILFDQDDVQIDQTDPIGTPAEDTGIGDWDSSTTYDLNDIVKDDDRYWMSVQNSNQGNEPSLPSPLWWMELRFISDWNTNYTYSIGEFVSHNGELWRSETASNSGNTPLHSSANWKSMSRELRTAFAVQTSTFPFSTGRTYLIDTAGGSFTGNLPGSPSQGDRVGFIDVSGSWATNQFTVGRSGNNIMALAENMDCDVNHAAVYLEYSGATYGWIII